MGLSVLYFVGVSIWDSVKISHFMKVVFSMNDAFWDEKNDD